jgi:hypothetical protein
MPALMAAVNDLATSRLLKECRPRVPIRNDSGYRRASFLCDFPQQAGINRIRVEMSKAEARRKKAIAAARRDAWVPRAIVAMGAVAALSWVAMFVSWE